VTSDPLWYKDAVIYQAHVRSFFDSTDDGVGDFCGLAQKLDYLQDLGVTLLWLLPFFPSPLKDDGYDISDYLNIHPSYGTLADFQAFVHAAHQRDIKVLIELVVNHTSDQHPWFQRARQAPAGSPDRNFYVWSDTNTKFSETRIIFSDTESSNWSFDPLAGQYYWHRFFSHQPDLNHNNPAVVEAVIDVMKFWLALGVDALRLDAVPYLCVREGTNNENLPETHVVLKRIRAELDRSFPNRMLLAEANQWPADVRAYFGDGDECQMAFHFPLMPRIFMALRQEDRHAITEILNQTPDIPETCQWALFLRNHDELTLEMVTDEERDYMYQTYAADPQMRINLGIRRRLAPLVENSRRRIELLNGLMCSLPGTPIIYYGDEIGMGDNIYLGDRNGVRTPMQWSGDRNGGFSRADPARLFAPAISDPVYGYQAINVEAQQRYPFSLLNWMKRLIALRKQHRVFGRGSLEILYPANRRVLAYVRRDGDDTVLVVANLSRAVQPVEIDLKAFAGLVPVEMHGQTSFPRISEQPYFLTLGPYACYWFSLVPVATEATKAPLRPPAADLVSELPALLIGTNWESALDNATRTLIERQAILPFLRRQPWFGSRMREVRKVRFNDWGRIRDGRNPAFLTAASIAFADGGAETYLMPLAFAADADADRFLHDAPGAVLARITGARKGAIVDGLLDDDVCERLLTLIERGDTVTTARGTVAGVASLKGKSLERTGERRWRRFVDNNSVALVDDRQVLKLYRRIEPGPHAEVECLRQLAGQGFTRAPALLGVLAYDRPGLERGTLALLESHVGNQGSGWDFMLAELRRYLERMAARVRPAAASSGEPVDDREYVRLMERYSLSSAGMLGRRTAEMHVALSSGSDSAFTPEPIAAAAIIALSDRVTQRLNGVFERLRASAKTVPPPVQARIEAALAAEPALLERVDCLRAVNRAGMRIRIHGDFHLGQVLRTEEDFVIVDFEGRADQPWASRLEKQSPLNDVAGMLWSFSYAAHAAAFTAVDPASAEAWSGLWARLAGQSFLDEYWASIERDALLPPRPVLEILLRALMIGQAAIDIGHELEHRRDWLPVPLAGMLQLL
jgi:maltose alpha-D-glucosyltransferase/alpha-amylase